jgi:protein-disulfide isomerase
LNDPGSPVGWNTAGDVTIVEFFDYQCPYCKAVVPSLEKLKKADSGVRYVYKEWPFLGAVSEKAARAALASAKQNRYQQFHEALISFPGRLKEADMKAPEITAALARTKDLAGTLGITGTPAFVVGGKLIPGAASLEKLQSMIKSAREGS